MEAEAPAGAEDPASDVLELTEEMAGPALSAARGFKTIDGQSDVVFDDGEPEIPEQVPAIGRRIPLADRSERPLMSPATSAAVDSAFNTLAHTVLVQNARTLEDLVREMLQPLLKTWLDDNLPGLVERLVRAEIERVSRGRG
jgi:cell pole-organizing protein PopZ